MKSAGLRRYGLPVFAGMLVTAALLFGALTLLTDTPVGTALWLTAVVTVGTTLWMMFWVRRKGHL